MKTLNNRVIIPILTLLIGSLWLTLGISEYGFWTKKGPGAGFFSAMIASVLILISIIAIYQSLKEEKVKYYITSVYPVIATVIIVIFSMVIGLVTSIFLYVVVWLKFLEKYSWKFSLLVAFILFCLVYGVFVLWLQVPLPKGYIFNLLNS